MKGQIVKISSDLHYVNCGDEVYPCKCRGVFRKEHIIPVVGDYVLFQEEKKLIEKVLPRKNYFDRPRVSNVDQAFLVTSLKQPDFSLNLLDKFLVLMEINNVRPIICVTKEDLVVKSELEAIREKLRYYEKLGYLVISNCDVSTIKKLISNKTSVFTGQTGVGKSTLLNKLNSNLNLATGEISMALGRGKHQTKEIILLPFEDGFIADTPGFSSLDLDLYKEDLAKYFPSFDKYYTDCYFSDCLHISESKCAVKKAKDENKIPQIAYDCYRKLSDEAVSIIRGQYK